MLPIAPVTQTFIYSIKHQGEILHEYRAELKELEMVKAGLNEMYSVDDETGVVCVDEDIPVHERFGM